MEELKAEYQDILARLDKLEQKGIIGAYDKRTIIELSGDVIREIAKKYENVKKCVGDIMRGTLIETEARTILNQGKRQGANKAKKEMALKMLKTGKLTIEEIAEYSELSVTEVEQLAAGYLTKEYGGNAKNKGVIWMIDAKARPFFMLDGTLEHQKEIVDKIASGLPLESIAEYFERNGIKMAECQNDVEMKQRSNDFKKRYGL